MVNSQDTRGKRRLSRPLEGNGPLKRTCYDDRETDGTNLVSEAESKIDIKKKRRRKRTKGLRVLIKDKIEVALRASSSPLSHLFVTQDDDGTPQAAYSDIIKAIGLNEEIWLKAKSLSPRAVESISNITDMFRIEQNSEKKLMLKYRPTEWNKDACTVYLDNLPSGCTAEKIFRLARKFGTVVEVRLPRSSSRTVFSAYGLLEVGKHPRSFAFVQFTEPPACDSMCSAFAHNFPNSENKEKSKSLVPLLQRLLMKIRILSKRRRRRTYAQSLLLMKLRREQAAIIKKERTANKRTCKMSRIVEHVNSSLPVVQEEGKTNQNDQIEDEHNTCSECGDSPHQSTEKRKKVKAHDQKSLMKTANIRKRKRRRKRKDVVGPHTIVGSVADYFGRIQVLPFVRYLELRREYVALRRDSDLRAKKLARQNNRFRDFFSCINNVKLARKLVSYRDNLWEVHSAELED